MVFGKIYKIERNGKIYRYAYVVKSERVKNRKNPKEKIIKYFGTDFEGFYNYLEKKGLFKGAIVERLGECFNNK